MQVPENFDCAGVIIGACVIMFVSTYNWIIGYKPK